MKKIEAQICESFDSVIHNPISEHLKLSTRDNIKHGCLTTEYYLHNELVFWYIPALYQFRFSLRGYNTPTTRSRLRALLSYFCLAKQLYMKQGTVYLETFDGEKHELDLNGIYAIFGNELKLMN